MQTLQDIDLTIRQGEIFGIIGRNGAGKSILLCLFNRLESADSGEVFIHGESTVRYSTRQLRDLRRWVAMIFQHLNLTATKTVAQNIALLLKMADVPAGGHQRRVSEMLELMSPNALRNSYPAHLPGGRKQRTGAAQVLATQSGILLCDEATLALDPENTLSVLTLLKEISQRLGLTIVLITHEMEVIRTLCDWVSVLEGERVVEQGDVWRMFGNSWHSVMRAMPGLQHPDHPEAGPPLRGGEQIVTLHFDGNSGRGPNLQHIVSLLGDDAQLLYGNCKRTQSWMAGQLQVRLSGPLVASVLAQDGWITDSTLIHHHQTAETTASQPSNGTIFPILC